MSVNNRVDIFTTSMRTEFQVAFEETAVPAPWEAYTTLVPSSARIEHYPWMSPTPGLDLYAGHRRYGKIESVRYSVENREFDSSFEVLLRDIEDDQTAGYALKPKELAIRAKKFPGRWVIKHLAAGETRLCFDGTAMFANSHSIGTGDNLLTFNGAADDATTFNLCALYFGGVLKPLIFQDRKPPKFNTNSGTPASEEAKIVRYWIDMEGEAAYGYWWDAVWVNITDTPTVAEMHTIFANIEAAYRTYQLPKSSNSEDGEYVHEQVGFTNENLHLVGSTGLGEVLRQALNSDWVPQTIGGGQGTGGATAQTVATSNRFKGWAGYTVSAFMN